MSIALLCPTRGRPDKYKRMVESSIKTAIDPRNVVHYTLLSQSDSEKYNVLWAAQNVKNKLGIFPDGEGENIPTVDKWNNMADRFIEDKEIKLFMLASDDIIFATPGWDKAILDHYEALNDKTHVYSLQDSRDISGHPHPICSREYVQKMGYFLPPIFLHWYVDVWTWTIAERNNICTHLKDYLLIHDKDNDRGQPDETHTRIRRNGWKDRDDYVNRTCKHFLEVETQRLAKAMH